MAAPVTALPWTEPMWPLAALGAQGHARTVRSVGRTDEARALGPGLVVDQVLR